jgi:hypothetical protein
VVEARVQSVAISIASPFTMREQAEMLEAMTSATARPPKKSPAQQAFFGSKPPRS